MKTRIKRLYRRMLLPPCAVCALLLLTSCTDACHEGENGLGLQLTWQDAGDAGTQVNSLTLRISAMGGQVAGERCFGSPRELAGQLFPLPAGEYFTLATANLAEPFTMEEDADGKPFISLNDASTSPAHAWYGAVEVSYSGLGVQRVQLPLTRVLSELVVDIEGAPDGVTLSGTVNNAAAGIYPAEEDTAGSYGVPSGTTVPVVVPETTAAEGSLRTATARLMPTAEGNTHTRLSLRLSRPDGSVSDFYVEAPVMKIAGRYLVSLKYSEIRSFMHLSPVTIEGWTEGWVVNGEILNPES